MSETLRATLIANAGLLLEYRGTTLLLDGIYGREGHPFSNLTDGDWQRMLSGAPPFDRIDYLLFSHAHPDHFSPELTLEYLRHRQVKGIFKPQAEHPGRLDAYLSERRIPCVSLSRLTNHAAYRIEPHITVRAFTTLHLDERYREVLHLCYLLSFDEKHVLFTADVDYRNTSFEITEQFPLRAAFINPLFFRVFRNPRFFKGNLKAEQICVYHVPFAEDDSMQMRGMLLRDLKSWPAEEMSATAFLEPYQVLEL